MHGRKEIFEFFIAFHEDMRCIFIFSKLNARAWKKVQVEGDISATGLSDRQDSDVVQNGQERKWRRGWGERLRAPC